MWCANVQFNLSKGMRKEFVKVVPKHNSHQKIGNIAFAIQYLLHSKNENEFLEFLKTIGINEIPFDYNSIKREFEGYISDFYTGKYNTKQINTWIPNRSINVDLSMDKLSMPTKRQGERITKYAQKSMKAFILIMIMIQKRGLKSIIPNGIRN